MNSVFYEASRFIGAQQGMSGDVKAAFCHLVNSANRLCQARNKKDAREARSTLDSKIEQIYAAERRADPSERPLVDRVKQLLPPDLQNKIETLFLRNLYPLPSPAEEGVYFVPIDGHTCKLSLHGGVLHYGADLTALGKAIEGLARPHLKGGEKIEEFAFDANGITVNGQRFEKRGAALFIFPFLAPPARRLDPTRADTPEKPLIVPGQATVTFSFVEKNHPLDEIPFPRRFRPGLSPAQTVEEELATLLEQQHTPVKPGSKKTRDSRLGILMETQRRRNYRMDIQLSGDLQQFFGINSFQSTEVFAKNSPLVQGGITASFNRFADSVTLLRKIENETGASDLYTGRADTLAKARELAGFMFLGELHSPPELQKGISYNQETGEYEFRFGIASLLTLVGDEKKKIKNEIQAFRHLSGTVLEVKSPDGRVHKVRMCPLPLLAINFNYINRLEHLTLDRATGKHWGEQLNRVLFDELATLISKAPEEVRAKAEKALFHLRDETLKPWQRLMNYAYLCHLLKIPIDVHCKSSVDRTNIAAAMITAMQVFLRSKQPVPDSIHDIVTMRANEYSPFKELFAYALTKGLKIPELARFDRGFKFERGIAQHPALCDLLPDRYLKKNRAVPLQVLAARVALVALAPLFYVAWALAFLFFPLTFRKVYRKEALGAALSHLLTPLVAFWNMNHLVPQWLVNEDFQEVGERSLIYTKSKK
jgi:hypothetical protein